MSWEKIDESTYQYDEGGVRFFLLMGKKEEIAKAEGVTQPMVTKSLDQAMKNLKKILKI